MKVATNEGGLFSYPDLIIVCGQPKYHDKTSDVVTNPTVIFEVLSPSTESYDRGEKFLRYTNNIATLEDYVLISQQSAHVEHGLLVNFGSYRFEIKKFAMSDKAQCSVANGLGSFLFSFFALSAFFRG